MSEEVEAEAAPAPAPVTPLNESPRLFVGGLYGDKVVEKWELEQVFAPYGDVTDIWVAQDPPGYAFVEMETVDAAREAMAALNNTEALGVTIRIERTKAKGGKKEGGGRGGKGGRGRGRGGDRGGRGRGRGGGGRGRDRGWRGRGDRGGGGRGRGRGRASYNQRGFYDDWQEEDLYDTTYPEEEEVEESEEPEERPRLYVGDLQGDITKEQLMEVFEPYGDVIDVWIAKNPKGYAFVEFSELYDAKRAMKELDGTKHCGCTFKIQITHNSRSKKKAEAYFEARREYGRGGPPGRSRRGAGPPRGHRSKRARPAYDYEDPYYADDYYYRPQPPPDPYYDDPYYAPPPRRPPPHHSADPYAAPRPPPAETDPAYPPARDPYYDDYYAAPAPTRDPYATPRDPYAVPRDAYATPRDPYATPRDPYATPRDPYATPRDPYATPRDPYAVPRDPYATPRDPYAAPPARDPYAAPPDPYAAAPAAAPRDPEAAPPAAVDPTAAPPARDPYAVPPVSGTEATPPSDPRTSAASAYHRPPTDPRSRDPYAAKPPAPPPAADPYDATPVAAPAAPPPDRAPPDLRAVRAALPRTVAARPPRDPYDPYGYPYERDPYYRDPRPPPRDPYEELDAYGYARPPPRRDPYGYAPPASAASVDYGTQPYVAPSRPAAERASAATKPTTTVADPSITPAYRVPPPAKEKPAA